MVTETKTPDDTSAQVAAPDSARDLDPEPSAKPVDKTPDKKDNTSDDNAVRMVLYLFIVTSILLTLYLACVNGTWCPASVQRVLEHDGFITAMVAALYLLTLLVARVLLIARPYRKSLEARCTVVSQRSLVRPSKNPEIVTHLLDAARGRLEESDRLLWSWGDQKGAFELISQAESLLAGSLEPPEAKLRLDIILPEIDRYGATSTHAAEALRRMERSLLEAYEAMDPVHVGRTPHRKWKVNGKPHGNNKAENAIKTVHSNALQLLHRLQLDEFARILKWHRKVLWLTVVGLGIAVLLVTFLGNAVLLLMGAAGAYVARLARIIKRADSQPEDTSSYWTNLLLGPLLGALAAYGGILLIELLREFDLLGTGLADVKFDLSGNVELTLAIAFLLGISEGLINRIAKAGETGILGRADPSEVMPSSSVSRSN